MSMKDSLIIENTEEIAKIMLKKLDVKLPYFFTTFNYALRFVCNIIKKAEESPRDMYAFLEQQNTEGALPAPYESIAEIMLKKLDVPLINGPASQRLQFVCRSWFTNDMEEVKSAMSGVVFIEPNQFSLQELKAIHKHNNVKPLLEKSFAFHIITQAARKNYMPIIKFIFELIPKVEYENEDEETKALIRHALATANLYGHKEAFEYIASQAGVTEQKANEIISEDVEMQ